MTSSVPRSTDLTVAYVRSLFRGENLSHVGTLQASLLCSFTAHGHILVQMGGNSYEVVPSPHNAAQLHLIPHTVTLNGKPGCSVAGLPALPLSWGICAFQSALESGEIVVLR